MNKLRVHEEIMSLGNDFRETQRREDTISAYHDFGPSARFWSA